MPTPADSHAATVILLLADRLGEDGNLSELTKRRIDEAVEQYHHSEPAQLLIVGRPATLSADIEAAADIAAHAASLGIPDSDIVIEEMGSSTPMIEVVRAHGWERVINIAPDYADPSTHRTLCAVFGPDNATTIAIPSGQTDIDPEEFGRIVTTSSVTAGGKVITVKGLERKHPDVHLLAQAVIKLAEQMAAEERQATAVSAARGTDEAALRARATNDNIDQLTAGAIVLCPFQTRLSGRPPGRLLLLTPFPATTRPSVLGARDPEELPTGPVTSTGSIEETLRQVVTGQTAMHVVDILGFAFAHDYRRGKKKCRRLVYVAQPDTTTPVVDPHRFLGYRWARLDVTVSGLDHKLAQRIVDANDVIAGYARSVPPQTRSRS
jgi:hypothetical protein